MGSEGVGGTVETFLLIWGEGRAVSRDRAGGVASVVCPPLCAVPCRGPCAIPCLCSLLQFFCSWLFRNSSWVHFVFISFGSEFVPTAHAHSYYSVQFSSGTQSCPTLCDPMNCSTPGLPVHYQLPEFTQTHVPYNFFVFCCLRRGVPTCKLCTRATKDRRSQPGLSQYTLWCRTLHVFLPFSLCLSRTKIISQKKIF